MINYTAPGDWMQDLCGRKVPLLRPHPEVIDINVIAHVLASKYRFGGHTKRGVPKYSVAQHCCHVAQIVPLPHGLAGLLHDGHEAYLSDLTTPLKRTLFDLLGESWREAWAYIVEGFDRAIAARVGLSPTAFYAHTVQQADLILLATEARDLMLPPPEPWRLEGVPCRPEPIEVWPAEQAEREFLRLFDYFQQRTKQ